jgi:hypothetical protein
MKLNTLLAASYNDKKAISKLEKKHGYKKDKELSNGNNGIFYNTQNKKLIHTVAGTKSLGDVATDISLLTGQLKNTARYAESKSVLEKAKKKYNQPTAIIAGSSLGGAITNYIAGKNDKAITHNAGFTFNQKSRPNVKHYRTRGDIVSLLGAANNNMKTLPHHNAAANWNGNIIGNALKAHSINSIADQKIFV